MRMNSINNHHNPMEQLLTEMRLHVSNLQDKLQVANSAVNKGQNVNGKIELLKEYQEKVTSLNSCWRTKNRAQLVSNLQQENRQIMALEEENRQLHMALKEMKEGMDLIMSDFRRVASDFMRAEVLSEVTESQQTNTFMMGVSHEKYIGIARAAETYMQFSDQKATEDQALIAQLCLENKTLRSLLQGIPVPELTNLTADKSNKTTDLTISTKSSPSETSSRIKI